MFAVSTTAGGDCVAAPDVCQTMPSLVPIPFVNMANCRNAVLTSETVLIQNKGILTRISFIPFSVGDTPPALSGVTSGVINHMCRFRSFSEKVLADGQPVVIHGSVTGQNGPRANALGMQVSPSQGHVHVRS